MIEFFSLSIAYMLQLISVDKHDNTEWMLLTMILFQYSISVRRDVFRDGFVQGRVCSGTGFHPFHLAESG